MQLTRMTALLSMGMTNLWISGEGTITIIKIHDLMWKAVKILTILEPIVHGHIPVDNNLDQRTWNLYKLGSCNRQTPWFIFMVSKPWHDGWCFWQEAYKVMARSKRESIPIRYPPPVWTNIFTWRKKYTLSQDFF